MKKDFTKIIQDLLDKTRKGKIVWMNDLKPGSGNEFYQYNGRYAVIKTSNGTAQGDNYDFSQEKYYLLDTTTGKRQLCYSMFEAVATPSEEKGNKNIEELFNLIESLQQFRFPTFHSVNKPAIKVKNAALYTKGKNGYWKI